MEKTVTNKKDILSVLNFGRDYFSFILNFGPDYISPILNFGPD